MPLVFSPLTEAVLETPPMTLRPKHAFVMRQLGGPPDIDEEMTTILKEVFEKRGVATVDAGSSTGAKDFLERILGLIRGTGFTVAVFSEDTRTNSLANIALELGFAAMCGKPLIIVKSKDAKAPSDLTRTDWIVYDPGDAAGFVHKLNQALDEIDKLAEWEGVLLEVALNARTTDCAVAFERANKAFLLTGDERYVAAAESIAGRLQGLDGLSTIDDLERLKREVATFILQARRSGPRRKAGRGGRAKQSASRAATAAAAQVP